MQILLNLLGRSRLSIFVLLENLLHLLDHFEVSKHVANRHQRVGFFEDFGNSKGFVDGSSGYWLLDENGSLWESLDEVLLEIAAWLFLTTVSWRRSYPDGSAKSGEKCASVRMRPTGLSLLDYHSLRLLVLWPVLDVVLK